MAIVYRHRRLDTFEVFYVGIGGLKDRAYNKSGRNRYWRHIVKKVGYTVEIIANDLSWENACDLESLLIEAYGRKDLLKGNLVNLTDGGDGAVGKIVSKYNRLKISKEISQYTKNGILIRNYESISTATRETGIKGINNVCAGYSKTAGGYVWKHADKQFDIKPNPSTRPVLQFDLSNNLIREYDSVDAAILATGALHISCVCKGNRKTAGGFIWKHKINTNNDRKKETNS